MKWIGERISFVDDKTKTTIVIYPENIAWVKSAMGAWVAMWTVIGFTVVWSLFNLKLSNQEEIILYVFISFWLYYAIRVYKTFFWILWGKELIKIDATALHYKKSIRKIGKSTPYYLENIEKINMVVPKEKSLQAAWEASPWIQGANRIEFEYMTKRIGLGKKLNQQDSKLLFNLISKRIEDHLKQKKY